MKKMQALKEMEDKFSNKVEKIKVMKNIKDKDDITRMSKLLININEKCKPLTQLKTQQQNKR